MTIMREQERKSVLGATVFMTVASMPGYTAVRTVGLAHGQLNPVVDLTPSRDALTIPQMVKELKEAGIPVSAIAEAARVERKTIYNWLDGAADARPLKAERLHAIYHALFPAGYRDLSDLYRLWATPLDGATLRTLLAAEKLEAERIRKLVVALAPVARRTAATKARFTMPEGPNGFIEGLETVASP